MGRLLTLHDPATARAWYASGVWCGDTLYGLLSRHARERPAAFALGDPGRRLTWAELLVLVDRVAASLHAAGLVRGDRVSVWLPNRIEAVAVLLACARNGYVCNPSLHQNYTVEEIAGLLASIQCKALFAQVGYGADAGRADVFASACSLPGMKRVFALQARFGTAPSSMAPAAALAAVLPEGTHAFPLESAAAAAPATLPPPDDDPDKVVYLAFTSGTTGTPKGVMHSDNTLLANARAMVADWRQDQSMVLLSLSPFSHHIFTVALNQTLVSGGELAMHDPVAGISALDRIEQSGATYVMGVPTHAIDLLATLQLRRQSTLGRVKTFYMAGSPIPTEVASRLLQLGATPQNVYGMTENGSHQYTLPTDDVKTITSTCGRACKGYEIRLWRQDDPDLEVAHGEVGEIGGRGGVLMLGYFGNQAATEKSFNAGGWFLSGDLGRFDQAGNLQIVGRAKDLVIRGGHNIHPARIEELAHRHPGVQKAAAFGVADERLGERVCLAIIAGREGAPAADELLRHLDQAGLSKFDMPEFFAVVESFPLTASGKILKRELVNWVKAGRIRPEPVRWGAGPAAAKERG